MKKSSESSADKAMKGHPSQVDAKPDAGMGQNQGEGNVEAGRHYDEQTREFVKSGKVDEAARKAAPQSKQEADEMKRAEAQGRERAKETDPSVSRDYERGESPKKDD